MKNFESAKIELLAASGDLEMMLKFNEQYEALTSLLAEDCFSVDPEVRRVAREQTAEIRRIAGKQSAWLAEQKQLAMINEFETIGEDLPAGEAG